jgi:hypothetical protein
LSAVEMGRNPVIPRNKAAEARLQATKKPPQGLFRNSQ